MRALDLKDKIPDITVLHILHIVQNPSKVFKHSLLSGFSVINELVENLIIIARFLEGLTLGKTVLEIVRLVKA